MCTAEFFSSIAGIPVTAVTVRTESASGSTKSSESTGSSILLLLFFKFVGMFPVFTVFVVFLTFFRVTQYFVGFIYLLKLIFGPRVIRIQVRMVFAGQLTESLLDIILGGAFVHSQYFVIVYVSHIIYLLNFICFKGNKIHANWLCSVFILLSLQRIFRNYSKGNEGIGNHIQVFYAISPAASCGCSVSCEGGNNPGRAYPYCHFL